MALEAGGDGAGVSEIAEFGGSCKSRRGAGDDRDRAEDGERDSEPQIQPLIADEAGRDPLVDDIALLEEELPWRHGRADQPDDEQHHIAELARRDLRNDEVVRDL